ncbi:MAG: MFS transporter [Planctomycetes bacterium]|nr:MFS transporter [Planctomycetota bacterium]
MSDATTAPATGTLRLRSRGFASFLATQFLGAFNDNAFKLALLLFLQQVATSERHERTLWMFAQALFALPFIVFASWAGAWADRQPKSGVIRLMKLAEIGIMLAGVGAFALGNIPLLYVVLFAMSTQSAFFGPGKYGYLAETVRDQDLSRANGLVQMTTMVAVVTGAQFGSGVYGGASEAGYGALAFVAVAVIGFLTSLGVPKVAPARPLAEIPRNPFAESWSTWCDVRKNRTLLYTVLGVGHFWLLGALLQLELIDYAKETLGLGDGGAALLMNSALIGIAVGSLLAARWSEGRVELGLVPLGAAAMSVGLLFLSFVEPVPRGPHGELSGSIFAAFAIVLVMGASGGLFIVPLQALLQQHAPEGEKGRFTAFGNLVSFVGVCISALFIQVKGLFDLTSPQQFMLIAALSLAGTFVSLRLLPFAFVRLVGWLLAHTLYRIRVRGLEKLPAQGGALVLSNHVSWVDALILGVCTRRGMHFLMYRSYYEWKPTHWFFKLVGCIPIASGDAPEVVKASLDAAGQFLDEGKVVVVFAEGAVTRLGHMLPFRRGYQRIIAGRDVPIVPVCLDGLWGSVFSHERGRLLFKLPRAFPYPVTVTFGDPLPSTAQPHEVRRAIRLLSTDAWEQRKFARLPLDVTLLREERRTFRATLFEPGRPGLSPARLLARAACLARDWDRPLGEPHHVAVRVRPGQDAAVAILAVMLTGRIPVPLDPSLPEGEFRRRLRAARCGSLVDASDEAAPALPEDVPEDFAVLRVDAAVARLGAREGFTMLRHALLPLRMVERRERVATDAPAMIVFAEAKPLDPGLPGDTPAPAPDDAEADDTRPRPVVLSHFNVISNVEAFRTVIDVTERDGVLGVLPLSGSYGLVLTLWLPLLTRLRVAWHKTPSRGRAVGKFVERHRLTLLPATPALLEGFLETTRPDQFGSLRYVLTAQQRLEPELRRRFEETFGITPVEAYVASEATALIALNTVNVRAVGTFQRGTRVGTVGHPLPGVSIEVVDPRTGRPLPYDAPGLLRVSGPGVMHGYLDDPQATARVLDGRVLRGRDLGRMDEDGFLVLERRRSAQPEQVPTAPLAPLDRRAE